MHKSNLEKYFPPANVANKSVVLVNFQYRVNRYFVISTNADLSIFPWHSYNWCRPLSVVYFLEHTLLFQSIQLFFHSSFQTGLGRWNLGLAETSTANFSWNCLMVPSPSAKISSNRFRIPFNSLLMLLQ